VALYTLTYVYRDSTAVLGPLAAYVEPHCYDLCARHADRLTVPRGWDVVRLPGPVEVEPEGSDDLEALANAVREATAPRSPSEPVGQGVEIGRRGICACCAPRRPIPVGAASDTPPDGRGRQPPAARLLRRPGG